MDLDYLSPSLIVVLIASPGDKDLSRFLKITQRSEIKDKLDEYDWFKGQPQKLPLKIVKNDKVFDENIVVGVVSSDKKLKWVFKEKATVWDLLEALHLNCDALKIVTHLDEWNSTEMLFFPLIF